MTNALLFYVKYPVPGKVKTRLARSIGFEPAARIYKKLVEDNLAVMAPLNGAVCDIWVVFDPPDHGPTMRSWLGDRLFFLAQEGDGLGERFIHGFKDAFARGYTKVIMLASDTLDLTGDILPQAFEALGRTDAVLGPAVDGGYYLIGMTAFAQSLFEGITWSTPAVYQETVTQIERLGWTYHALPPLDDLDDVHNLRKGMLD